MQSGKAVFETELRVRPDDIGMDQHVHGSRDFDGHGLRAMANVKTGRAKVIPERVAVKYAI